MVDYDFEEKDFHKIADLVYGNNLLEPDGMLIIEHSKHTQLGNHPNFSFYKRYGGSVFSFFENEIASGEDSDITLEIV